jgi:hypothetical protein
MASASHSNATSPESNKDGLNSSVGIDNNAGNLALPFAGFIGVNAHDVVTFTDQYHHYCPDTSIGLSIAAEPSDYLGVTATGATVDPNSHGLDADRLNMSFSMSSTMRSTDSSSMPLNSGSNSLTAQLDNQTLRRLLASFGQPLNSDSQDPSQSMFLPLHISHDFGPQQQQSMHPDIDPNLIMLEGYSLTQPAMHNWGGGEGAGGVQPIGLFQCITLC